MNEPWTVQRLQRLMRALQREAKAVKRKHKLIDDQMALAAAVGVTDETVSRWMTGRHLPHEGKVKRRLERLEERVAASPSEANIPPSKS